MYHPPRKIDAVEGAGAGTGPQTRPHPPPPPLLPPGPHLRGRQRSLLCHHRHFGDVTQVGLLHVFLE